MSSVTGIYRRPRIIANWLIMVAVGCMTYTLIDLLVVIHEVSCPR